MVLVQKWPFLELFFFGNLDKENVFYYILERKNGCLRYKNKKSKKAKNWHFPKGVNPWFWSKNGHFSNLFFLSNLGQQYVFYDILKRKNAILGYKHKKFKHSKYWHFSQRVNLWFWSKNGHFSNFFFKVIYTRKMSFTIFEKEKTPFYGIKTKSPKSRKFGIFAKGLTHGFGRKMGIFSTFSS